MTNEQLIEAAKFYYINDVLLPEQEELVFKIIMKNNDYTLFRVYRGKEYVCECSVCTSYLYNIHNVIQKNN